MALAELLARAGESTDAERELRRALTDDPRFVRAALSLAQLLRHDGRAREALPITAAACAYSNDPALLLEHTLALRAQQRDVEALALLQDLATAHPQRADIAHYLALSLHAAGRYAEASASASAQRALDTGLDEAGTWGILARALAAAHRLDEAEDAFRQGLQRDADAVPLHEDYARLLWLRSGDLAHATAALDAAVQRQPDNPALLALKAQLHGSAGDKRTAYALFAHAATLPGADAQIEIAAATAALKDVPERALEHARRAAARAPELAQEALIQALLVRGEHAEATTLLEAARAARPDDQQLLALQAVLWRSGGDARYRALYDYARTIQAWTLDTPPGWGALGDYLADLRATLRRLHALRGHPPDQSLRGGSQTMGDLSTSADPVLRAFFDHAFAGPIARHIARLGQGGDPLRRRNRGRGRVHAAWSVLLQPNGYHVDHVHPDGWLSSACYIDMPDTLGANDIDDGDDETQRAGWLRFGAVPLPLTPPLRAEFYLRPQPGLLVLFPSYMWHGTVPFSGTQTRLTIAFDVVPA